MGKTHKNKEVTPKPIKIELVIETDWAASLESFSELNFLENNASRDIQDLW